MGLNIFKNEYVKISNFKVKDEYNNLLEVKKINTKSKSESKKEIEYKKKRNLKNKLAKKVKMKSKRK